MENTRKNINKVAQNDPVLKSHLEDLFGIRKSTNYQNNLRYRISRLIEHSRDHATRMTEGWNSLNNTSNNKSILSDREWRDAVIRSRKSRYLDPFIIRGCTTIQDFMFAKPPSFTSKSKKTQLLLDLISQERLSDVFTYDGMLLNSDTHLTDGYFAVRVYEPTHETDDLRPPIYVRQDILEVKMENCVVDSWDGRQVWLWYREFTTSKRVNGETKSVTRKMYYPDIHFYPDDDLKEKLTREYANEREGIRVMWDTRMFVRELNGGVPVVFPAIDWAQCVRHLLELEMSKWEAISEYALMYQVDREDVDDAKNGFAKSAQQGTGEDTNVFIGTGKLSTLNINVALAKEENMKLYKQMVYNVFPALRPQSWAEDEVGGLNVGSDKNEAILLSAQKHQSIWKDIYLSMLEYAIILNSDKLDGINVAETHIENYDGDIIISKRVSYDDPASKVFAEFPEIKAGDAMKFSQAILDAFTLGGKELAIGTPEEYAKAQKRAIDIDMSYNLIDNREEKESLSVEEFHAKIHEHFSRNDYEK